jgi:ArsR family transcriptional regulator
MDMHTNVSVFDRMSALGDLVRGRVLVLLEEGEFTVSELVQILQLPQSTVSRHLKVLADDGWVFSRSSGTSRYYRLASDLDPAASDLWSLVRPEVLALRSVEGDAERALAVMAQRRERSRAFFATSADRWDRLRDELFGIGTDLLPFYGLLDPGWTVGDLGAGTGHFAARVSPFVDRVIAVDASPEMRKAARSRLDGLPNAEVRAGELEDLPIADRSLDVAVMILVLHYIVEPVAALSEARRVLRPGGRLVVVDMKPHTREGYREEMGHVWPGFDADELERWCGQAQLTGMAYRPLPARADASGPLLFVASASRDDELNTQRLMPGTTGFDK